MVTASTQINEVLGCSLHANPDGTWTTRFSDGTQYTFGTHIPFTEHQATNLFFVDVELFLERFDHLYR